MRNNWVPAGHESYLARSTALLLSALGVVASLLVSERVVAAPPALPQEYRTLAGLLAMPLKTSPDEFEGPGNLTETLSSGHTTILSLKDIKSSDRQVEYITRQTEASLEECLQRAERLNALPKPPGTGELLANSFIDGFMGNPGGGYARGLEAEQMQTAIKNELYPLFAAMEKLDATHQMLAPVAKKYAANLTYPANRITVDLDESWGSVGPFDWLYVYNQGPAIRDATVVVKLTGADGATRTNVHFVPSWDANTWLYGRYEAGLQALGKSVGQTTVHSVKKVEVTVYSPSFSTAVSYTYEGTARDSDIAKYCQALTFSGRYQPYVERRYLPDTRRGVEFTLDGLEGIPSCQVKVTFWKGLLQKTETWEFDYWKRGDKKMFRPKDPLESDPTMATIEISFPGTSYRHRYSYFVAPQQEPWGLGFLLRASRQSNAPSSNYFQSTLQGREMENDPKKQWYVKTPQGIFGPYTSQQLKQFGEEGNVHAGYQVRKGPDGEWVPADKIRGLKTRVPVAEPVTPAVPSAPHRSSVANRARASRTSPIAWLAIVGVPVGAALLVGTIIAVSSQSVSNSSTPGISRNTGDPTSSYERSSTRDRQVTSSPPTVGGNNSPMSVREIVQANEQSVLLLRGAVGSGTGFIVGDQLLVTNSHVVAVAALNPATGEFKDLRAYSPAASAERRGPYRVSLLYEDPDWDLAVLRILDRVDFRPVAMAKNYQFQRGEAVTIIGNPGLFNGVETLETAVSTGILSTTHPLQGREHYQLGAAVNGGNSGGPVFGEAGQVIGVVVSKSLSEDEISFCIPVREAIRATAEARSISARSQQLMWKEHESRVPKAIANLAVPSGSIVTVANPPWAFVFIASTADDLIEASEYAYAGNTIGMQQLIASGRVMMVDSGTKVEVIDSNMFCAVKILNGLYAGRTGLVSIQCLK